MEIVHDDRFTAVDQHAQVLVDDPSNEAAIAELGGLMRSEELRGQIGEILEPIYRQRNDFEKLAAMLDMQSKSSSEAIRSERLREVGLIRLQQLEDAVQATANICEAFRLVPVEKANRDALFTLTDELGPTREVAELIEGSLSRQPDLVARDLRFRLHDWFLNHLGDETAAEDQLTALTELYPDDDEILDRLQGFFEERERWLDLSHILNIEPIMRPMTWRGWDSSSRPLALPKVIWMMRPRHSTFIDKLIKLTLTMRQFLVISKTPWSVWASTKSSLSSLRRRSTNWMILLEFGLGLNDLLRFTRITLKHPRKRFAGLNERLRSTSMKNWSRALGSA